MDTSPCTDSAPQTAVDPARLSSPSDVPVIPGPSDTGRPRETSTSTYRSAPSDASRGGETWMDFLRGNDGEPSATPNAEADATRLADRKRRLNVAEPSGRRGGYRSSSSQGVAEPPVPGSSSSHAIDLTASSPERPAPPSRTSQSQDDRGRRESDIMIPTWQPDSDVSNCPVCDAQFTFWYRKHHCRKCGRVVCAGCSPHRITIPRQYIVRAPEEIKMVQQGGNFIDLTADSGTDQPSASQAYNPALGGGEECVPDPNFSPPPQDIQSRFPDFFSAGFNDSSAPLQYTPLSPGGRSRNFTFDSQGFSRLGTAMSGHRPSLSDVSSRHARSDDSSSRRRGVGFGQPSGGSSSYEAGRSPYSYPHNPSSLPFFQHLRGGRSTAGTSSSNTARYRFPGPTSSSSPLPPVPPPPPAPRRVVPEEDECPICHDELPPKGPDGSTAQREAHVEDCIAANFAGRPSTSTPNPTGTATPGSTTSAHPSPAGTPPVGGGGALAESSARGRRRATHGMLRYRASEKDCVDEKGEPQECIICFEEFAVGDEMGRLECFCKFHRACIRSWWDTKGDGSCPTHQGSVTLG